MIGLGTRRFIPRPLKTAMRPSYRYVQNLRYEIFLRRIGSSKREILILATITKSGTHYMRFLIANYIKHLRNRQDDPVAAREIDVLFPNGWHHAYLGGHSYKSPTPLLRLIGLHDIPRSHIPFQRLLWNNSRVLHVYRNPLDYAVSLYMYKYEYYEHLSGTMSGPVEVLDAHLDEYVEMYLSFRKTEKKDNTSLLSIAYEDLIRYPEVSLATVLRWLGFEPVPAVVDKAVQFSSEHLTALVGAGEIWQRNGTVPVNPKLISDFTNKLIEKGSVGSWKDYFEKPDIRRIEKRLDGFGINLYDFILDS